MRGLCIAAIALVAAACTEMSGAREGDPEVVETVIEALGEDRFAVSVTARNVNGYELARCVAAGHVDGLRDEEGERLYDVYSRDGGRITDEFRIADNVRTQTSSGVQTYVLVEDGDPADHDGRDVMSVDLQLVECEKAGLPTAAQ